MSDTSQRAPLAASNQSMAVDIAIRLTFVGLLAYWSLLLIGPFVIVGLWGIILAVALYPTFVWLKKLLAGRGSLAAALLTIALLIVAFGPASLLAIALVENLQQLADRIAEGALQVPPPPQTVQDWPFIGKNLYQTWYLSSTNLGEALDRLGPQLRPVAAFLLSAAAAAGIGVLQLLASVIIAGFLYVPAERLVRGFRAFAKRVVAKQGDHFVTLAGSTIRNVARGVIGISLLQSLLIGLGLLAAGIPGAGLITLGTLVLGILQIGPGMLVLPTIIWAWLTHDVVHALIFTAYMVPVTLLDNFLKPIVLAHGLATPMLIIFIGVIGGTLAHGLIGLFVGPIVLAVGYELLLLWVAQRAPEPAGEAEQ